MPDVNPTTSDGHPSKRHAHTLESDVQELGIYAGGYGHPVPKWGSGIVVDLIFGRSEMVNTRGDGGGSDEKHKFRGSCLGAEHNLDACKYS